MRLDDIRSGYANLQPEISWAHHFDLGTLDTISAAKDEKFRREAIGLKKIGIQYDRYFTRRGRLEDARILDVACGDGGHSISFASSAAKAVIDIAGRPLYVERGRFVARALGVGNDRFE